VTERFLRVATGVDMLPVMLELNRAPHLWDRDKTRRTYPGTPHAEMEDIWVRFRAKAEIEGAHSHREPYRCVFWPAWHELPALRPIVFSLMARVGATELGSVLITKLPPGGKIHPHSDKGSWAAEFYNCKCHVTIAGTSVSVCDDQLVEMHSGDVFTFDNLLLHSVENRGSCDRIACIVSMRVE
jgi:hypothetical protein